MPNLGFRYLSEPAMIAAGVLDAAKSVDVCEEVFRLLDSGDYIMGGPEGHSHGIGLALPAETRFPNMPVAGPDRRFVAMPAYIGGRFDMCGNKWYGSNSANPASGLPRSIITILLNDKETGEPVALMSGNLLSAARTGAIPALASRLLAPNACALAIIGCGVINRAVVNAVMTQQSNVRTIVVYDIVPEKAEHCADWIAREHGVSAKVATSAVDCVDGVDLISIAASRTHPLMIPERAFSPRATVLLSGPLASDDALWSNSRIVYDSRDLHEDYMREAEVSSDRSTYYGSVIGGPIYRLIDKGILPRPTHAEDLAQIVSGRGATPSRIRRNVFVSCGMAIFDVALATVILRNACSLDIGIELALWDQPHQL
ncbi:ornithine cyclodeaminase [Nocardia sp. NPDC004722]